jgi:hypothetical protein
MKIYLFNPETGVYLGEDFADEAPMRRCAFVVPPGATTIAPPEVGRGHILVFDVDAQCWKVRSHWVKENLKDEQPE